MNLKNLIMWAIIVLLSVGLFNMFQDPKNINSKNNKLAFSNFLSEVESEGWLRLKFKEIISQVSC